MTLLLFPLVVLQTPNPRIPPLYPMCRLCSQLGGRWGLSPQHLVPLVPLRASHKVPEVVCTAESVHLLVADATQGTLTDVGLIYFRFCLKFLCRFYSSLVLVLAHAAALPPPNGRLSASLLSVLEARSP